MGKYIATVTWERADSLFTDYRYSRRHEWQFDGGLIVAASSSPLVVPVPLSDPTAVDPEEAFVASLSSCHMLWFLSIAAKRDFTVDRYHDAAEGVMALNDEGKLAMTVVTLRPQVTFSGESLPSHEEIHIMHHQAHDECFIARSVRTNVRCEPVHLGD
ncbi:MAG: OsmC family protein [Planctomycetia bacterium]|nr:OsmC family protein [Planctomycetia bacterium]